MMSNDDPYIGKHFHEYRIERLIGSGNMGQVYLAFDYRLRRNAAIKVTAGDFRQQEEFVDRIVREAQVMAQLSHTHIVQVYRLDEIKSILYFAMQYIEGADLSIVLDSYKEEGSYIETTEAIRIIREVASAIDYAHQEGFIHRDIKPSNVMLDTLGRSFLTDFGMVRVQRLEASQTVFGTPNYIAPEQALSAAKSVPQSDVYSLGVVLYEMMTNNLPFKGDDPIPVALMHVNDAVPSPRLYRPEISPEVELVLLKALAKEPTERYQTASELADAFEHAYVVGGIGASTMPPIRQTVPRGNILARTRNIRND